MASLPESWKLTPKKRADGKLDIVGKDDLGSEYVARTTDTDGVTDHDLAMLALGNRGTSSAKEMVDYCYKQRADYNAAQADSMTDSYMDGAEQVVRAGLHLSESRVGYSRAYARKYDSVFGEN